ncbi:MAG TPA: dockerin type I repeat-containing protein [candidate division Zixibacteria bacterium]
MRKFNILICFLVLFFLSTTTSWSADSVCGDANGDTSVSVSDVTFLINYLFKGGPTPQLLTSDVNGDFRITVSDVVYLVNYLFKSGTMPACAQVGAIKGRIYLNGAGPCCNSHGCYFANCPDANISYCSIMNPYPKVKVSAFSQGNLIEKTFTDQAGNFYLRLPEGSYSIKIYPPQDEIDSLTNVVVVNYEETDLGQPHYIQFFVYQVLELSSYATQERLQQIMTETGNQIIDYEPNYHLYSIEVPEQYHPQEMIEILMHNYPDDIIWAEVSGYPCPDQ